jgi:hypothetical protein
MFFGILKSDLTLNATANSPRPQNESRSLIPGDNNPPRSSLTGYLGGSPGQRLENTYTHEQSNRTVKSVLHTTQLPVSEVFLDQALAVPIPHVSPWEHPTEWARAEAEYVDSIVSEISELTGNAEIGLARSIGVYPVSYNDPNAIGTWANNFDNWYSVSLSMSSLISWSVHLTKGAFGHLSHFRIVANKVISSAQAFLVFKEKLREWKTWDSVTTVQQYQEIRTSLLYLQVCLRRLILRYHQSIYLFCLAGFHLTSCKYIPSAHGL